MSACMSVRLSVCLLAYLRNHMSKFHQIFCAYYPCPWLGFPLTSIDDVLPFCDNVVSSHDEASGPESKTTNMFRPVRQVAAPGMKYAVPDRILL